MLRLKAPCKNAAASVRGRMRRMLPGRPAQEPWSPVIAHQAPLSPPDHVQPPRRSVALLRLTWCSTAPAHA